MSIHTTSSASQKEGTPNRLKQYSRIIEIVGVSFALIIIGTIAWRNRQAKAEEQAENELWPLSYYIDNEEYDKAEEGDGINYGLHWIIEKYPHTKAGEQARYKLAYIYMKKKEFEQALDYLQQIRHHSNSHFDSFFIWLGIAICYEELKNFKEAEKYYQKAIAYHPDPHHTPLATMRLASMYEKRKMHKKAWETLKNTLVNFENTIYKYKIAEEIARLEVIIEQKHSTE